MQNITINPKLIGVLRTIAYVAITAVVAYLANPANLTFVSGGSGLLIAAIFAAIDHQIQANGNGALFGMVR